MARRGTVPGEEGLGLGAEGAGAALVEPFARVDDGVDSQLGGGAAADQAARVGAAQGLDAVQGHLVLPQRRPATQQLECEQRNHPTGRGIRRHSNRATHHMALTLNLTLLFGPGSEHTC